jgi:hypothetical protein
MDPTGKKLSLVTSETVKNSSTTSSTSANPAIAPMPSKAFVPTRVSIDGVQYIRKADGQSMVRAMASRRIAASFVILRGLLHNYLSFPVKSYQSRFLSIETSLKQLTSERSINHRRTDHCVFSSLDLVRLIARSHHDACCNALILILHPNW